jgi:hypothetical protein
MTLFLYCSYGFRCRTDWSVDASVLEKHAVSLSRVEIILLLSHNSDQAHTFCSQFLVFTARPHNNLLYNRPKRLLSNKTDCFMHYNGRPWSLVNHKHQRNTENWSAAKKLYLQSMPYFSIRILATLQHDFWSTCENRVWKILVYNGANTILKREACLSIPETVTICPSHISNDLQKYTVPQSRTLQT